MEVLHEARLGLLRHLIVLLGQVEQRTELLTQVVVETAHDDIAQIVPHVVRLQHAYRPGHRVDEHQRLSDTDRVVPERAQSDQAELRISVGHRLRRAPLEVGEQLEIHEHDLHPER